MRKEPSHQWEFPLIELILNELDNSRHEGKDVWLTGNERNSLSREETARNGISFKRKDLIFVNELVKEIARIAQQRNKKGGSVQLPNFFF